MKFTSILWLSLLGLALPLVAKPGVDAKLPPKDKMHVYLVIGGARMVSANERTDERQTLIPRCYLLNENGQWVPAAAPLNRYSTIGKDGSAQKLGLAEGFVETMLKANPDASIGLVVNAGEGADLEDWGMKTRHYREARRRTKQALRHGVLKGIVWHGGGSKSPLSTDTDHLKNLIAHIRADQRMLNLPVVLAELPGDASYNAQLAALPQDVHATAVAGLVGIHDGASKALAEDEIVRLGQRSAERMLELHREWPASRQGFREPGMPVIDAHVHAMSNKPGGLDPVAAWMERNGVARCIVSPIGDSRASTPEEREHMLANFKKFRGRIDRFCLIKPGEVSGLDEAVRILEKEKAAGAIGFGEHYGHDLMFDDPKNLVLYEACQKVGLPVMFHIDATKNMVEAGMRRVERVLKMYPDCVIIAHAYWWLQFPDGTCERMMRDHPNLYADVSGLRVAAILNRERKRTRDFIVEHADRVMFCSDAGWWSFGSGKAERELQFALFEELDLPPEVLEKVYRGNAERLFGFRPGDAESMLESRVAPDRESAVDMAQLPKPRCCAD